ncbi:MAG: hypothetical protein JO228_05795 [Xanthobacteraceae bacterium]|nr:hypothetical protein [Xanthobacteraceae bacterium]
MKDATDFWLKGRKALVGETGGVGLPATSRAPFDLFGDLAGRLADLVCTSHDGHPR